ncbi:MAG: family 16 glycosylhydrolase [Eubacterium sp.]|nr:family 16 glycosylhydrolase [Eubacterium sp.]
MKLLKRAISIGLCLVMAFSVGVIPQNVASQKVEAKVTVIEGKKLNFKIGSTDDIVVKGKAKAKSSNSKIAKVKKIKKAGKYSIITLKGGKVGTTSVKVKVGKSKKTIKVTVTPETVTIGSANLANSTSAKITWKKTKGAKGYYVYRSTSYSGGYKKIATVKTTSYINKNLSLGNYFYYKVRAYGNKNLLSPKFSKVATAKTWRLDWSDEFTGVKYTDEEKAAIQAELDEVNGQIQDIMDVTGKTMNDLNNDSNYSPLISKRHELILKQKGFDTTKWHCDGYEGTGRTGYGNQELQDYQPEYSEIKNGIYTIKPRMQWNPKSGEMVENSAYATKVWTKHVDKDHNSFYNTKYGKVEFRAKMPKGVGTWAAGWMLGAKNTWPLCGEIDVFETTDQEAKTTIPMSIHCGKFNGMSTSSGNKHGDGHIPTATTAYHTYAVEWTPKHLKFLIDGKHIWTYDPSEWVLEGDGTDNSQVWPYCQNFYLILNCAVGGTLGGQVNPKYWTKIDTNEETGIETYEDYLSFDYVRVYK